MVGEQCLSSSLPHDRASGRLSGVCTDNKTMDKYTVHLTGPYCPGICPDPILDISVMLPLNVIYASPGELGVRQTAYYDVETGAPPPINGGCSSRQARPHWQPLNLSHSTGSFWVSHLPAHCADLGLVRLQNEKLRPRRRQSEQGCQ